MILQKSRRCHIVLGLGFGDEGKGLFTDFYANKENAGDALVIRFSGGHQAGHTVMTEKDLAALRQSANRGTPFGSESWTAQTAKTLGLESTLRPRGRPRKSEK